MFDYHPATRPEMVIVLCRHSSPRWLAWFRTLPVGSALALGIVLLGATQAVLGELEAPLWSRVASAVLIALVSIASELDKLHTRHVEKVEEERLRREAEEAAEAKWLRDARDALRIWPAPPVGDVDQHTLGVARWERPPPDAPPGEIGPYIRRDIDQRAIKRLRAQGALLLLGAPASGVTRTAYEVAKAEDTTRMVLAPEAPLGPKRALVDLDVLSRLAPPNRLVLWLDRVDRFREGGLTAAMLRDCQERSPGLRVVASIATTRYEIWAADEPELAGMFGEPVRLERLATPGERERATRLYPEMDFSEGIAAAFTATGALLVRLRAGDSNCRFEPADSDCALAQTVVQVAISWAGTGTPRPLATSLLGDLVQMRLQPTEQLIPAHLAKALDWATRRIREGVSLLSRGTNDDGLPTVSAHPGVAELRNAEESTPDHTVWAAALTDAETAGDSEAIGRIGFQAHLRGYRTPAANAWAKITSIDEPATRWLEQAASFSHSVHQPAAEIPPRERLLELAEAAHGPDHPDVANALQELGRAWLDTGKPVNARNLLERALSINERHFGPDDHILVNTLSVLGGAWKDLGQPAKALDMFERVLRIEEREHGPDHPGVARALGNVGVAWMEMHEPAKGREMFERALPIQEREYGPDHPRLAETLGNLGNAWVELGYPDKARELLERALPIKEREYGPDHPDVALALGNLASALSKLEDVAEARDMFERALRITQRHFGPDHPRVAFALGNLGVILRLLGEPAKARDLHERELHILENEYGPDHPMVARALDNLGITLSLLEQPAKARDIHQRALHILEKEYGQDHLQVAPALNSLAGAWAALGQPAKARQLLERAIRIRRVAFPPGHPEIGRLISNLRRVAPDVIVLDDGRIIDPTGDDRLNGPINDGSPDIHS
jgi:tetratricopeptide (TPR) repeat protein